TAQRDNCTKGQLQIRRRIPSDVRFGSSRGHLHCTSPCPLYPRKRHQKRHMECPLRASAFALFAAANLAPNPCLLNLLYVVMFSPIGVADLSTGLTLPPTLSKKCRLSVATAASI